MRDIRNRNAVDGQIDSKLKTIVFSLVLVLCFLLIFFLNRKFPLCLDDWTYSFVYGEQPVKRLSSISDIIRSQYNHYFMWGGRSVVHFIAQWLLMQPEWVIDVLNSLVYTMYILLLYKICNYSNRSNILLFLFIYASVWFLFPAYFYSVVWTVGSANYLWGAAIRLLFIYPYCIYFLSNRDSSEKYSLLKSAAFLFTGIIAGWTNENTAAAMIFLLFSFLGYWKIAGRQIPLWALFGLIGSIIGFVVMVIAPGNYIRTEQIMGQDTITASFSLSTSFWRLYDILRGNILQYIIAYVSYFCLMFWYIKSDRGYDKNVLLISFLFFVSANTAVLVMIVSPAFPPTVWSGIFMYLFLAFGILFANIRLRAVAEKISIAVVLVLSCALLVTYKSRYETASLFSDKLNDRIKCIESEKGKGNRNIKIKEQIDIPEIFYLYLDVTPNTRSWQNQCYLEYFDLDSIVYIVE